MKICRYAQNATITPHCGDILLEKGPRARKMGFVMRTGLYRVTLALLAAACAATLAACGTSAAVTEEDANTVYGTVTAVDGQTVTLALGTPDQDFAQDGRPVGTGKSPRGTLPAGGQGPEGTFSPDGQFPNGTPPSNASPGTGQRPEGTPPAGGQNGGFGGMSLTPTGKERTITVADESVITTRGGDASGLDAIQVGSILMIVYDADGKTITSIQVMGGLPDGNGEYTAASPGPTVSASP